MKKICKVRKSSSLDSIKVIYKSPSFCLSIPVPDRKLEELATPLSLSPRDDCGLGHLENSTFTLSDLE